MRLSGSNKPWQEITQGVSFYVKELIESLRDASVNVKSCLLPLGETSLHILIRFRSFEFCAGHVGSFYIRPS
jgi:hypothetical protein